MLAFPHRFLSLLGPLPGVPRALKDIKPAKKKDYVLLARLLLQNDPTECTRRSVEFLIGICNGLEPDAVPPIKWLEEEPAVLGIQLGAPSAFSRIAPVMRLRATIR